MPTKGTIPAICLCCGESFLTYKSNLKRGGGTYCSRACYYAGRVRPLADRFWEKVNKSNDCWEWTGSKHQFGYGQIGIYGKAKPEAAHRVSWELHFGPIPAGMLVRHRCDNPACVRPDHLCLGTHADNMQDMAVRDRVANRKLIADDVREIRRLAATGMKRAEIAERFDVSVSLIWVVVSRRYWSHVK